MSTLYDIDSRLEAVADMLEAAERMSPAELTGAYPDLAELGLMCEDCGLYLDRVSEYIDGLYEAKEAKIQSVARYIKELEMQQEAIKAERKRLADRAESARKRQEWLERYLLAAIGEKSCTVGAAMRITVRRSQSVQVTDEAAIPDKYLKKKTEINPDKMAIKRAIASGESIPGACLVENSSLKIS